MRVSRLLLVLVPMLLLVSVISTVQGRRHNNKRQVLFPDEETGGVSETETGFTGATGGDTCQTPDGTLGICTLLKQCPSLVGLLDVPTPAALNYLRQSICGYLGFDPQVCCSYGSPYIFGYPSSSPPTPTPMAPPRPAQVLPARCGLTNATSTRIVGGEEAPQGAWPWIALLGYRDAMTGKVDYVCGGVLISHTHIVTAAHCVHNRNDLYSVRLGEHDINSEADGGRHQEVLVATRSVHESFNSVSFQNDIAVLKLAKRVEFNALVQPICLPMDPTIRNKNYVKSQPFVAGWGATSFQGPTSPTLREVQIPVVTQESCREAFKRFQSVVVDDKVLCAGLARGGKDACQGDSGGPLMIPEKDRFYLLGVVSFGHKCAEPGYPGVYTRVAYYLDWILARLH